MTRTVPQRYRIGRFDRYIAALLFVSWVLLAGGIPTASAASDPLLATASASGAGTQEYHSPDGWWQRISYQVQVSLRLEGHYVAQEDAVEVYQLTRKQGSVRFWGTAEDHIFGALETWKLDDQRSFDLATTEGLLRFLPSEGRVVYVGFALSGDPANGIRPYRLRIYGSNSPPTLRLYAELPSKWWIGPQYDVTTVPEALKPVSPDFQIFDCKMVSPTELGVGLRVRYPSAQYSEIHRKVLLEANINGTDVRQEFDVTPYTKPGEFWGRVAGQQNAMYDINGNLLPTTPLRVVLADHGVGRFAENIHFTIFGLAASGEGLSSLFGAQDATILLPVVMLHGYIHPFGYPYPPWLGGPIFPYELAYKSLKDFMLKAGYENVDKWPNYDRPKYRTYWDPHDFNYTDPQDATPAMIYGDVARLLQRVLAQNYARKVNFVAHSFGGLVARNFAATSPDQVNKIITVGTPHQGATFFYEVALSEPNKAAADNRLTIKTGPGAGQFNALLWTVPTYEALVSQFAGGPVTPPYQNTLTSVKAPGVRYFALYCDAYDTVKLLGVEPINGWFRVVNKTRSPGDAYILASSASAFADSSVRVGGATHAFLLAQRLTQDRIYALLADQATGATSGDDGTFAYSKGQILPGATVTRTATVKNGVALAVFELDWEGSTLALVLRDPAGRVLSSKDTNAFGGMSVDLRASSCRLTISDPMPGEWSLEVQAINVPPSGEEFWLLSHLLMPHALAEPLLARRTGDREITLAWPASGRSRLEASSLLAAGAAWSAVTNVPVPTNGMNVLTLETSEIQRFYRLMSSKP